MSLFSSVQNTPSIPLVNNPLLNPQLPSHRAKFVLLCIFLAFLALFLRAIWLQAIKHDYLQQQGAFRYARTLEMPALRGKILDRNGVLLASSLSVRALWADPQQFHADSSQLTKLSAWLEIPMEELNQKLQGKKNFVYLKRQVDARLSEQVESLKIPGVHSHLDYKRYYPQGEVLAHVVGFTDLEDVGQEGIELAKNSELTGNPGIRRVIKNRLGQIVEVVGLGEEPAPGHDLELSIDSKIQFLLFEAIREAVRETDAKAGAGLVLDAKTGEVLALANWPTYDPNVRGQLSGEQLRNRVITDTFEPGSTIKPFTIALALDLGVVKPGTIIQTGNGRFSFGSHVISDTSAHGDLTAEQVLQKSSNIGTAKIALSLPARKTWDFYNLMGLGHAPQIGFPGAVAGRLRPYRSWRPIEQATMGYGYGLSLSLLQIAGAYTVFANSGRRVQLSMFRKDTEPDSVAVMTPETADAVKHMLEMVTIVGGTAKLARVPGYRVGGKTGTAYKRESGQYVKKYLASFIGLAPISNPRLVVAVMIDEPHSKSHFGGQVAAPVFAKVAGGALRILQVPLDVPIPTLSSGLEQ